MLYSIINSNRYNVTKLSSECSHCRAYDGLADSYMSIIDEDDFLAEPQRYIDNAFEQSENSAKFTLRKTTQLVDAIYCLCAQIIAVDHRNRHQQITEV